MKFTKFIVLAGGLVGLLAFFLPLVAVKGSGVTGALSAYRIVKGIDSADQVVSTDVPGGQVAVAAYGSTDEFRSSARSANESLSDVKPVVLAIFAPALLLALIGGIAVKRKKFGRLGGVGALLFGGIGLGIWAILNAAANEVAATGGTDVKGMGMWLLMITGLCGVVAGILTLAKPDRGPVGFAPRAA